jgi:hypothetical protein
MTVPVVFPALGLLDGVEVRFHPPG